MKRVILCVRKAHGQRQRCGLIQAALLPILLKNGARQPCVYSADILWDEHR